MHRSAFYPLMGSSGSGAVDYWYAAYNFDTPEDAQFYSFDVDSKGNIYFGGGSSDSSNGYYGKLNPKGDVLWCRYVNPDPSGLRHVIFVGVGSTDDKIFLGLGPDQNAAHGYRIDGSDGSIIWQQRYSNGSFRIQQGAIDKVRDNFAVTGFVFRDFSGQLGDTAVVTFDENGGVVWANGYGTNAHDGRSNNGFTFNKDGNSLLSIGVNPHGATIDTLQLTEWNQGDTRERLYGIGGGGGRPTGIACSKTDDFVYTGVSFGSNGEYMGRYSPNGTSWTEDWAWRIGGGLSCTQSLQGVKLNPSETTLYHNTQLKPSGPEECHIFSHDTTDGSINWQNVWKDPDGSLNFWCKCLIATEDYVIVGGMKNANQPTAEMWMAKVPTDGSGLGVYGDAEYAVSDITALASSPGSGTRYVNNNATNWGSLQTTTDTWPPINLNQVHHFNL